MAGAWSPVHGTGLGLRRALLGPLAGYQDTAIDFLELAPDNWIGVGGRFGKQLRELTARWPFTAHGLSLSLGGPAPLDEAFLQRIKAFLDTHGIQLFTEHLSYCSDDGQLYDLMPVPFTDAAVEHVATRVRRTQEILERRIAVENVSYYAAPGRELDELSFINAVLTQADCDLLLDVNNVYVNSVNHGYDPQAFLAGLPAQRVVYLHVAGHDRKAADLAIDTHGAAVIDPVWDLLDSAYARFGVLPTLLERDFNMPPFAGLLREIGQITQRQHAVERAARVTG